MHAHTYMYTHAHTHTRSTDPQAHSLLCFLPRYRCGSVYTVPSAPTSHSINACPGTGCVETPGAGEVWTRAHTGSTNFQLWAKVSTARPPPASPQPPLGSLHSALGLCWDAHQLCRAGCACKAHANRCPQKRGTSRPRVLLSLWTSQKLKSSHPRGASVQPPASTVTTVPHPLQAEVLGTEKKAWKTETPATFPKPENQGDSREGHLWIRLFASLGFLLSPQTRKRDRRY